MVKVRSLESVPLSIYVYVMYYIYVTSGLSLLIESVDCMIVSNSDMAMSSMEDYLNRDAATMSTCTQLLFEYTYMHMQCNHVHS